MTRHPISNAATAANATASRGFVLLEALIALLIFALAVLGLVGLQASMTRATSGAKYRADAAYLASDLVGTMWTDSRNLALYDAGRCAGHPPCQRWMARVSERLPTGIGSAEISQTAPGQVTVKVTWKAPSDELRQFRTTTAITPNTD
ncbi:pilus assembly protein PilV [Sphaerotilus sp.]|uniref:type IV pilus modification PilV family protein n=1 Tax=Sphaerotilus sp. TaxID=2093942 RepID=UPI002ACD6BD5|nr:pilus assembly protein PilV [Sphaerotilus sp.]MDZ7858457.1 pilus assembly protein PilV [Sphaerotilus sp.]